MTSVRYQILLFDRMKGQISIKESSAKAFSSPYGLKVEISKLQSDLTAPLNIIVHQTRNGLEVNLVLHLENTSNSIVSENWQSVDDISDSNLESMVSFLYKNANETALLAHSLKKLKKATREYLTRIRLEPVEEAGGWPRQSVHPDMDDPSKLVRVGWSASGKYRGNVGVIGTSLGILTSLLAGLDSIDAVIQDSVQTLRLLQKADGGWATNDTDPISVLPSTTFALWALRAVDHDMESGMVQKGLKYVEDSQHSSGGWGLCKLSSYPSVFSTCRALQALKMYRLQGKRSEEGLSWLRKAQNSDGGWGIYSAEDRESSESMPSHTAYALQTLVEFDGDDSREISRAKKWLIEHSENGNWSSVRESDVAIDEEGTERGWWYSHKSTPWGLYALLLESDEQLLAEEMIAGILGCLQELHQLADPWKKRPDAQVPMWRVHDNLLALEKFLECSQEANVNISFIREAEFSRVRIPYNFGSPVKDKSLFFGREKELQHVCDHFTKTRQDVAVNIYGQRRAGKTSFLYRIAEEVVAYGYVPVLIDMQRYIGTDTAGILHDIAHEIQKSLTQFLDTDLDKPVWGDFKDYYSRAFLNYLDRVKEVLGKKRLLLMLDEFECWDALIAKGLVEEQVFEFIRHLMLSRNELGFILTGTHRVDSDFSMSRSAFLGAVMPIEIGYLDEEAVCELIIQYPKAFGSLFSYTPNAIELIAQLSGGQPNVCQAMCYKLVQFLNDTAKRYFITQRDVECVQNRVIESIHAYFQYLLQQECSDFQRNILYRVASHPASVIALEDAIREVGGDPADVQREMDRLVMKGFLKAVNGNYGFRIGLFSKWLQSPACREA